MAICPPCLGIFLFIHLLPDIDANPGPASCQGLSNCKINATVSDALTNFVVESDKEGIDLQFYCGEQAGPLVVNRTKWAADWCRGHPTLCGDLGSLSVGP